MIENKFDMVAQKANIFGPSKVNSKSPISRRAVCNIYHRVVSNIDTEDEDLY